MPKCDARLHFLRSRLLPAAVLLWAGAGLATLALTLGDGSKLGRTQQLADNLGDVCVVAPPSPYDAGAGVPMLAPRPVPDNARCPVCGMYPARAPEWAAQLIFDNGDAYYFDSPLSLFIYQQDVGRYARSRKSSQIAAIYVQETGRSGAWIDANDAVYVSGSSLLGPMRAGNLPAFASAAAAQHFINQYGGELLQVQQISPQLLQSLSAHRRPEHTESHGRH